MMKHISGDKAKDRSQGEVWTGAFIFLLFLTSQQFVVWLILAICPVAAHWPTKGSWIHRGNGLQILIEAFKQLRKATF